MSMNNKISMDHNTHENSLMNYSDGNTRVDNENETIILNDNKENTSMQSYQVTHFNQDKHLTTLTKAMYRQSTAITTLNYKRLLVIPRKVSIMRR